MGGVLTFSNRLRAPSAAAPAEPARGALDELSYTQLFDEIARVVEAYNEIANSLPEKNQGQRCLIDKWINLSDHMIVLHRDACLLEEAMAPNGKSAA